MTRTAHTSRLQRLRAPLLALGIALSSFAAAQSAPEGPVNPDLGPAFATKTAAYVGWVALFSVCAGLIFGAWVDGAAWTSLALVMGACLAGLAVALAWLRRRQRMVVAA